jgi:hypothetical protein
MRLLELVEKFLMSASPLLAVRPYRRGTGYCHTGESRYPVTLSGSDKVKVTGFRVNPGMTNQDLLLCVPGKNFQEIYFWTELTGMNFF